MKQAMAILLGLAVTAGTVRAEGPPDGGDCLWVLELGEVLPGKTRHPLRLHLDRHKDTWRAVATAPTWNLAGHQADPAGLVLERGKLSGTVEVVCNSDGYVPSGGKTLPCRLKLDASAGADQKVKGTYEGTCGTEKVNGTVTGLLQPRPAGKADGPFRLELVSPSQGRLILWAQAREGKLHDGYVFDSQSDAPADLSKLELRDDSIGGEFAYAVDSPLNPQQVISVRGLRVGALVVGTAEARLDKKTYNGTFIATLGQAARDLVPRARTTMPAQLAAEDQSLRVGVPPGYDEPANKDTRYPVMYGFGVGPGGVGNASKVPFIQCYAPKAIAEFGLDAVIEYVDRNYRTVAAPYGRAVMGYSAGTHIAFRYFDRVDKIGAFVFTSHPLRGAGWPGQKEFERAAILRGLEKIRKLRPAIIFMAGSAEVSQRPGCLMQRDLLREEFGIPCTYLEAAGGKHQSPRHTQLYGAWVYEWINRSFAAMAKGGQGLLPPELVPVDNPPALTKPLRVKFCPLGEPALEGWRSDTGKLFGPREDGLVYGWHYDCSHHFAKAASEKAEAVHRTFFRMPDQRQVRGERYIRLPKVLLWEAAVPNGTYRVRLLGGDPDFAPVAGKKKEDPFYTGPANLIDVEGKSAVPPEQAIPTQAGATFDVTVTAEVKDGRLTVSNSPLAGQVCLAGVEITAVAAQQK